MGRPVVFSLPRITLPRKEPFPGIELKNVKIKLSSGTVELGFPSPKVSFNFEVMDYELGGGIQPIVS